MSPKKLNNTTLKDLKNIASEKKKSEGLTLDLEKFKLAVDNASDHIVITNNNGLIVYANKAVKKVTGFNPEAIIGMKAGNKKLWGGQMDHGFYVKLWNTIKIKKKVFHGEVHNKRKNGEQYIASISISPILDKKGEVQTFVGVEHDVTKEREIDKAKSEFVSLAAHQLRTPLTAIKWYAEILKNRKFGSLNQHQKKYLTEIEHANKRMVNLVNALLNVSRLELGTFTVEPVATNILTLCDEVLADMKPQINIKKLKLKINHLKNFPLVMVDPQLIRLVLQNLISNAIKYTPEQGLISVTIIKDSRNISIKVKDTGLGIPKLQQGRIFEKLFRADNVKKAAIEGTGLGLYIIKSIMDKSGGKVSFWSEENVGTEFTVSMPISGMKKKAGRVQLTL